MATTAAPPTLRAFLDSRRVTSASWNITGLGNGPQGWIGKYHVSDDDYGTFLQVYHEHVFIQRKHAALLERHSPDASPILIDLDFRTASTEEPPTRHYSPDDVTTFVTEYAAAIHRFLDFRDTDELRLFVHETPAPRIEDGQYKDGIHIICPGAMMRYDDLFALRKYIL